LAEVLGTPFFSSAYRLPAGELADEVSPSGAYVIVGEEHPMVIGPLVMSDGARGRPVVNRIPEDVIAYTFDSVDDAVWVSTKAGELQVRDAAEPSKVLRRFPSLGGVASVLRVTGDRSHVVGAIGDQTLISLEVASSRRIEWRVPVKVRSLESSPNGGLVAVADEDGSALTVFCVGSGDAFSTYPGDDSVNSFTFDPSGNGIVVGERGGKVWRWIPDEGGGSRVELGPEWPGSIDKVAVSADGTRCCGVGVHYPGYRAMAPRRFRRAAVCHTGAEERSPVEVHQG
jgi:hypothetical protein